MQVLQINGLPSYLERLKLDRGELDALFRELLIGVTQFFRNPDAGVMAQYAPAYFVIDRRHEILRFSGSEARHYLEPSPGTANLNLFGLLQKALRPAVRAAVQQALSGVEFDEQKANSIHGFGRELLEHALPYQLDATTRLELGKNGMRFWLVMPWRERKEP